VRVCTVINRAWVAHARALAESLRSHEPEARLSVLIVDPLDGLIDPTAEPFDVLSPSELGLEDFEAMSVRYGVTELCCALKPSLIEHLLGTGESVVYLDSDVRLFAPLDGLSDGLESHPLLLAPHLLSPLPDDGLEPNELAILLAGSFNLGFAAARDTPEVRRVLTWWAERLRTGSRLDPAHAMVFDQRWADLMPGLSEAVGAWRDPGVDFGYWRAATHRLERDGDAILVDEQPLRCFHFTGFDPDRPERLSKHSNRAALDRDPVLRDLCAQFAERLFAHGHAETRTWPYGYGATASGVPLDATLRELWDRAARAGAVRESPFTREGEAAFLRWLGEVEEGSEGVPVNRYLAAAHTRSLELRERFPDIRGSDHDAYLAWGEEQAERHPGGVHGLLMRSGHSAGRTGLRRLRPGETLGAERGEAVVCIPVYGAKPLFAECLVSVLAHTPRKVRILIADDASRDPAIESFVTSLAEEGAFDRHDVAYMRQPENVGFPANVNAGFAAAAPADVVVLNSDCVVATGWLQGLRRASYSDALVATASALTNHGTILSVPERNRPLPDLPQHQLLEQAAEAVLAQSMRLYPRLPTAVGHCMYIRRQALDLVGGFDLAFSPGYGEEVDFSQRCLLHGLVHVAADDVFVLHRSGGSFGEDGDENPIRKQHEEIIDARYPYYQRAQTAAGSAELGTLPRSLASARRAMTGLTATIDARCLGRVITGTQVHTLEVIQALSRTEAVGMRVIVPPDIGGYAEDRLAQLANVELLPHTAVHPAMGKTDIVHRPYQVSNANDLLMLQCAGERAVITHQDLIAYRNPGYFPGYPQWKSYCRLTREALAAADRVVFFSHHAAGDALREDLVEMDRIRVVYIGVDHGGGDDRPAPVPPRGAEALGERPMLLCLGTDFRHKNRVFALRLLESLRDEHGWDGALVLAGPRVSTGSSAGEEAEYLATRPDLAARVLVLPAVSEAEKAWLFDRCDAVLYPTTYEGFGLMPFEAAAHDRPCLFASHTALVETLPADAASLTPWDPVASAARAYRLLSTPGAGAEQIREIRQAGKRFTWQAAGESLVEAYWAAVASPTRAASRMAFDGARAELEREEAERKYNELWSSLTPDARALVAPDGPLSPEATSSLAAVARRPMLRRLLLGPSQILHRLAGGKRNGAAEPPSTPPETFALHFSYANAEHMREQTMHVDTDELIPEP
jgi:GT2 family glycosyltransferase/glycosyltransferase involved in cell wall biosynthesis